MALGCGDGDYWSLSAERGEWGGSRWNSKVAGVASCWWPLEPRARVLCRGRARERGSGESPLPVLIHCTSPHPGKCGTELDMEPQVSRSRCGSSAPGSRDDGLPPPMLTRPWLPAALDPACREGEGRRAPERKPDWDGFWREIGHSEFDIGSSFEEFCCRRQQRKCVKKLFWIGGNNSMCSILIGMIQ